MNIYQKHNLKLLNLMELGHSGRTIMRVVPNVVDRYVTKEDFIDELGNTPTCEKIINDMEKIDYSYYSIYCLVAFDVNLLLIERIKRTYKSLNDLAKNFEHIDILHLQERSQDKIVDALKDLNLRYISDIKTVIVNEIKENEPLPNNILKEKILNEYPFISVEEFDETINCLINDGKIIQAVEGLKMRKITIYSFIATSKDKRDEIVYRRIHGDTLQQIADDENVTRERIRQIVSKRVAQYPIFYNEEKYYRLLNMYDCDDEELSYIGFDDKDLVNYIKIKYELNPTKNAVDYLVDFNIKNSEEARTILEKHKLALIDGELFQYDFISIFKRYLMINEVHSFDLDEIKLNFNVFLYVNKVLNKELYIGNSEDIVLKGRKLYHLHEFLQINGSRFYFYQPDMLSSNFIETLDEYLAEFNGYGSVGYFYDNNKDLCNNNFIYDENELFVVTKALFGEKYSDKIEFVRNPTILTKGTDKNSFLENLILDMNLPCRVEDFLDYVHRVTGLKQSTVMANYWKLLNQYKNSQGLLDLEDEVTKEQYDFVSTILETKKCVSYSWLNLAIESKFGSNIVPLIINANTLKKIDYVKTNIAIYSAIYPNRLSAVLDSIDDIDDFIIKEYKLYRIANMDYFYSRCYDFIDTCAVLKISSSTYLNLRKRGQDNLLKQLKKDLFDCLNEDEIYVLRDYETSYWFGKLVSLNDEYKELLYSFDSMVMIKNIIMTTRDLQYIESGKTFIFAKKEISIKLLIDEIMHENEILSLYELQEILYDKYNIEKNFSNSELSDMGYYCPRTSERVYLSKEYYEKELEDYLNGNT